MRISAVVPRAALLLIVVSPALLRAQFQEPTKEELQMTTDPKAPGAAYVYLYREDLTDQSARTHTWYERIKVLNEKGMESATVKVPYIPGLEKLPEVEGRTIHSDGTVIPLAVKPSDLVDVKTKEFQVDSVVFTLPSVEVGSILEYRVKEKYAEWVADPNWMIQQPVFVHKAHYFFKSSNLLGISYMIRMGVDAKVNYDKHSGYALDLADIPPLPNDEWMPPINTLKWRVSFFYTLFPTSTAFWIAMGNSWAEEAVKVVSPTGTLKKAAAELVSAGDSDSVKAHKIYEAVMKCENTDYTREKSKVERKKEKIKDIHTLDDVWKQQRGGSDELALLFVALGRAAGLDVAPMVVVDRNRAVFDESFLSLRQLNDYIAVIKLDGKDVYLDPGEKMCPFGFLHWKHSLTSGLRLNGKAAVIERTPPSSFKANAVSRVADLTVDPTGAVDGLARYILSGQEALHWRQLALRNDEEEVKKQFNEDLRAQLPAGVQADFDHFVGLNDYEQSLMAIVKVTGTLGSATGKRLFVPGLFFESRAKHPFVAQDNRTIPVDVHYAKTESDEVTYHLPAGYTAESVPQPTSFGWGSYAMLKIKSQSSPAVINVTRIMAYGFTILDPKEYTNLRDFYRKVAEADQQPIVLTCAVPATGN